MFVSKIKNLWFFLLTPKKGIVEKYTPVDALGSLHYRNKRGREET